MAHATRSRPTPAAITPRRRRWPRRLLWIGLVVVLIFYGAGGWYFSDTLRVDGLDVNPHQREYRATLSEVTADAVTISQGDPADGDLFNSGVYGLFWEGGFGTVTDIIAEDDTTVTRRYTVVMGPAPIPGDRVDVDPWVYPEEGGPDLPLAFEDVEYRSPLGAMDAVFVPGVSDTWAILVHGKNATPRETYRLGAVLADEGYPLLAITHRNDRNQPGDPSGYHRFGLTEWEDLEGAVRYSLEQGADDVILGGLSTGAAIALAFLEKSELADRVSGVILDAPNIDYSATIDHSAKDRTLPLVPLPIPSSLVWTAKTMSSIRFGVDWRAIDYVSRADRLPVPVLALHGTDDPTVPIEVSRELAAARADLVRVAEFEGAKHVQSWNMDPERYSEEVRNFLSDQ